MIDFKTDDIQYVWSCLHKIGGEWQIIGTGNSFHAIGLDLIDDLNHFLSKLENDLGIDQKWVELSKRKGYMSLRITQTCKTFFGRPLKGNLVDMGLFIPEMANILMGR